jgi:hypothetical protein
MTVADALEAVQFMTIDGQPMAVVHAEMWEKIVVSDHENELIQAIYQGIPIAIQQRYDELRECLHEETLTTNEHQELLHLVDVVEQCEVDRLEKLIQLAKLRQVSLDELMQQLNLKRSPSYV